MLMLGHVFYILLLYREKSWEGGRSGIYINAFINVPCLHTHASSLLWQLNGSRLWVQSNTRMSHKAGEDCRRHRETSTSQVHVAIGHSQAWVVNHLASWPMGRPLCATRAHLIQNHPKDCEFRWQVQHCPNLPA